MKLETFAGRLIGVAGALVFTASWTIGVGREHWATRTGDAVHTYAIRYKGGSVWFFPHRVGWFLDHSLWIVLGLLLSSALTEWGARRRVRG